MGLRVDREEALLRGALVVEAMDRIGEERAEGRALEAFYHLLIIEMAARLEKDDFEASLEAARKTIEEAYGS